jgi:hypothetical protein
MIHRNAPDLASGGRVSRSATSDDPAGIDRDYRFLRIRGLSVVEAGNVVAYLTGLHAAEGGWTVDEIKHLVAIRAVVATGVIASQGRGN